MNDLLHVFPSLRLGSTAADGVTAPSPESAKSLKRKPSILIDNPVTKVLRGANRVVRSFHDGLTESERQERRTTEERKQILGLRMKNATSAAQWTAAAQELDCLEGNDFWKLDSAAVNGEYNPALIVERMHELDQARTNCDLRAMLYLIRTSLSRDLGGMGNTDLYRHSYIGTKQQIEQYVDSAVKTIQALVEKSSYPRAMPAGLEDKDVLEGLLFARQSFGRSALLLSGGGTFGMMHIGVLKGMFEAKMLPRIISGASAGSIVCAVLCTRIDEEIPTVLERFPYGDLAVFESQDAEVGLLEHFKRLFTEGSWSDITNLTRVMRSMLGDMTFQEAYNRTRRICNICVSTASAYELPRLLNYVTAPNVMIWSAVAASCSVPLVFSAAPLLVKDPVTGEHMPWNPTSQQWIDGSVDNDLPMTRLAEMFNVNHFIVSQVNPHIVPFLSKDDRLHPTVEGSRPALFASSQDTPDWLYTVTTLAKDEAMHRLQFMAELGIFPNLATKLRSVLSQKYSGDITILPEIPVQDLTRILTNPSVDFMVRACLSGERATWPKLSRIRDRLAIELAIDRAVHALRARVVFSPSQVDLRRLLTAPDDLDVDPEVSKGTGVAPLAARPTSHGQSALHKGGTRSHHRRGSGSSIQLLARQRKMYKHLESELTDGDTEEEERIELSVRRGEPGLSLMGRSSPQKPKLRRAAKSQLQVSTQNMMASPLSSKSRLDAPRMPSFDFSKPIPPPKLMVDSGIVADDVPRDPAPAPKSTPPPSLSLPVPLARFHRSSSPRLDILSPTSGDPETSDHDLHTSDADMESHTDESDPEPYEAAWLHEEEGADRLEKSAQPGYPSTDEIKLGADRKDQEDGLWD